jgi:beta-phosphoglucomutase-like phosphatase (HAD superfamily)
MTNSPLTALIFDVDGTLADTERDGHRVAFNRAFNEAGLDWHWDVALYGELLAVTGGKERIRHFLAQVHPAQLARADLDAFIADLHRAKTVHYNRLGAEGGLPLRPGVARLLQTARTAGLRLAIATTTTPENVTTLLENSLGTGSSAWFECIGAGDIVPAKKPAPDIYRWVLAQMQLPAAQCLAFEDSENGLRAACGAALRTIVTVNDYTAGQNFDAAAVVLSDLGEPNAPFNCLRGDAGGAGYADLETLQRWHRGQ